MLINPPIHDFQASMVYVRRLGGGGGTSHIRAVSNSHMSTVFREEEDM